MSENYQNWPITKRKMYNYQKWPPPYYFYTEQVRTLQNRCFVFTVFTVERTDYPKNQKLWEACEYHDPIRVSMMTMRFLWAVHDLHTFCVNFSYRAFLPWSTVQGLLQCRLPLKWPLGTNTSSRNINKKKKRKRCDLWHGKFFCFGELREVETRTTTTTTTSESARSLRPVTFLITLCDQKIHTITPAEVMRVRKPAQIDGREENIEKINAGQTNSVLTRPYK